MGRKLTPEEEESHEAEIFDNLDAAMTKVAESIKPTRKATTGGGDGQPVQKQVLIRASEADHERWRDAAEKNGMSMSEFIRVAANDAAARVAECQHPIDRRKTYPWASFCLECNKRLSG